jgi:hypothetical protein
MPGPNDDLALLSLVAGGVLYVGCFLKLHLLFDLRTAALIAPIAAFISVAFVCILGFVSGSFYHGEPAQVLIRSSFILSATIVVTVIALAITGKLRRG